MMTFKTQNRTVAGADVPRARWFAYTDKSGIGFRDYNGVFFHIEAAGGNGVVLSAPPTLPVFLIPTPNFEVTL